MWMDICIVMIASLTVIGAMSTLGRSCVLFTPVQVTLGTGVRNARMSMLCAVTSVAIIIYLTL